MKQIQQFCITCFKILCLFNLLLGIVHGAPPVNGKKPKSKVGNVCTSNADCSQELHEHCFTLNFMTPACESGVCKCVDGTAINAFGFCSPYEYKFAGDVCTGAPNEILAYGAVCNADYVECRKGYTKQGSACFRSSPEKAYIGKNCSSNSDCLPELLCDTSTAQCGCSEKYHRYDDLQDECLPREFGDACVHDEDCRTPSGNWHGYTFDYGACIDGKCGCSRNDSRKTEVSWFDDTEMTIKSKVICIANDSIINGTAGDSCTSDPVFFSYVYEIPICNKEHVCYRCPEDVDVEGILYSEGTCSKCSVNYNGTAVI